MKPKIKDFLTQEIRLPKKFCFQRCLNVIVNKLDQAMACPGIWFNIILGVPGRVLLDEVNI